MKLSLTRRVTPFPHAKGGLNEKHMSIVYAKPGTLPRRPEFMATKMIRKGFVARGHGGRCLREAVMYRIFEIVQPGLAPPAVRDKSTNTMLIRWVKGLEETYYTDYSQRSKRTFSASQAFDRGIIYAIDMLTGQSDRHSGNVMCSTKHVHPIDNEMSFYPKGWDSVFTVKTGAKYFDGHIRRGVVHAVNQVAKKPKHIARLLTIGTRSYTDFKTAKAYSERQVRTWCRAMLLDIEDGNC